MTTGPILPDLPEPTAWNCQLVMNESNGIVEGWFTTKAEDDPDDIPHGWNARIERLPVYTAAQVNAIRQSAVNAALEWASKKADSESDLAQTARDMAKSDEIAAVFHQRVWASRKIATAIRAAIKESEHG